jgi:hypothetical protein
MRSGTGRSFRESQIAKGTKKDSQMNPIIENLEQSDSEKSSQDKSVRKNTSEDDGEDLGRSDEDIDLDKVEVNSKGSPVKPKSKPILTSEEVAKIRSQ